ncbi:aldo/keto reductase [Acinetobacter qingfengensis]|uniref:L-glyceraldehyde 3-phosphate reductase n=1 Tax=Acinetobacter qingfengensis TaxID=1262585 RepID=A0A1E7R3L2_9GAMM|nr:aldo/keto reductase [Acinetobacter qingfengensis]OEY93905.1 L-glyceraldehyde 3-phosphate reductase [Acinetobacter qingfengensis]
MYIAAQNRYEKLNYRKAGKSGLVLPPLSLGCWHNFGDDTPFSQQKQILHTAFDAGINHFDLANNYGTPYGSAERNIGHFLKHDFKSYRDELIISTKAGWDMWPGPYGQGGSSRKYLISSLDQSLQRLGLEYVDIFYSHRYDPDTPLEETAGALADIVKQGKALYIGISSGYNAELTMQLATLLAQYKVPVTLHQPLYNLFHQDIEQELFPISEQLGFGIIVFSPLAQGLLGGRYLQGVPQDSRIGRGSKYLTQAQLAENLLNKIKRLNGVAANRQQTLAQLALSWVLRNRHITSAIIGASRPEQILENVKSLENTDFSSEELSLIQEIIEN